MAAALPVSVWKFVATGKNNKLALLVAVHSTEPQVTLQHYLKNAAVEVLEQPTQIPGRDPNKPGIDLIIKQIDKAPYFQIGNHLKLSFLDLVIVDPKTKPNDMAAYWSDTRL